jgi:hypothetical protein
VEAIIAGCGGSDDDLRRFASAWRKLAMAGRTSATVQPDTPAAGGPDQLVTRIRSFSAASWETATWMQNARCCLCWRRAVTLNLMWSSRASLLLSLPTER